METPIQTALRLYDEHGGDFSEALKWHLGCGVVLSMPTYFLMGFWCYSQEPRVAVQYGQHDCINVTMCVGVMHEAGQMLVDHAKFLAYEREFKNDRRLRVVDLHKFHQQTKWVH